MSKLVLIFLSLLHVALWWRLDMVSLLSGQRAMLDFDSYHALAQAVSAGTSPYQVSSMQTLGPPLVIMPFLMLSGWPLVVARSGMTVVNVLCLYGTSFLIARRWWLAHWPAAGLVIAGLVLSAFPTRLTLELGQTNLLNAAFLTMALTTSTPLVQGLALSVATVIKTYWLTAAIALRAQVAMGIWWGVGLLAMLGLSMVWMKPAYYQEFWQSRAGLMAQTPSPPITTDYYNQSSRVSLQRIGFHSVADKWWWYVLVVICLITLVAGTLEVGLVTAVLVSPVVWQHYLVALAPIYLWVGKKCWGSWWLSVWLVSVVLAWIELPWLHAQNLTIATGWLASHYWLSVVLLWLASLFSHPNHQRTQAGVVSGE